MGRDYGPDYRPEGCQVQEGVLSLIAWCTGVLVGGTIYILFSRYRRDGEWQLVLKMRGAGLDPTRRGAWYAEHVTRPVDLVTYMLMAYASAVLPTSLFWWLLLPPAFLSGVMYEMGRYPIFVLWVVVMTCCYPMYDPRYRYWGAGRPYPADEEIEEEMEDDTGLDEMDMCEDGA